MMKSFREAGALISFDVNYRAALWEEAEARETLECVLPYTDLLFVSEETARRMLGMSGELSDIHRTIAESYPGLKVISSTKRRSISPSKQMFSSLVYDCETGEHFEEEPYRNIDVVDRIGSGDAYVAGALFALLKFGSIRKMAEYGDAMAALKNTILGDTTQCDLTDIERIIRNHLDKGPKNEMIR